MRRLVLLLTLLVSPAVYATDIPEKYRGNWLLVNGSVALTVAADGTMTLRNTGETGPLIINPDNTIRWTLKNEVQEGRFDGESLLLRNSFKGAPAWMEFLEFRKGTHEQTQGVLVFESEQKKQQLNAFAKVRQSSIEKSMLNDARQIGSAAQMLLLEKNLPSDILIEIDSTTGKVSGPLAAYVSSISPGTKVIDARYEASGPASFSLQNPDAYGGHEVIFDDEGKLKK